MRIALHRVAQCAALLFITTVAAWSQPVSLNWPLTSNPGGNSSNPALATANAQSFSGGTAPTVTIFDYASGTAQRLNAGSSGWTAGPAQMARRLQFDALPAAGHALTVTSVTFNHGATNVNGQIKAEVRYSTNNWTTSTVLIAALPYPASGFATYTAPISAPPIPSGGSFSLRILPYASINSSAGTPTFAAHNQVKINGNSKPVSIPHVRFELRKSTGSIAVPGTYTFGITCTGGSGPYTGPSSVNLVVPSNPSVTTLNVPQGSTCTITETPPTPASAWGSSAMFGGSSSPITIMGPWKAKIGPMPVNTGMTVTNQPQTTKGCPNPTQTTIGCRATVTIKRTKGPAIYSVVVSPPATAPTPNIAPSTASSCVIAGGAMINQTTCWFNYNTNTTAVTLTATSSSGTLPTGFSWSGACSGSSATCLLNVTPVPLNIIANFP
jgi:hypothetical protein